MKEDKDSEDFFLFLVRGILFIISSVEKRLLFDKSLCILTFQQSCIGINIFILEILGDIGFGKYWLWGSKTWKFVISKLEIFSATIMIKILRFQAKAEVNKPGERRIVIITAMDIKLLCCKCQYVTGKLLIYIFHKIITS